MKRDCLQLFDKLPCNDCDKCGFNYFVYAERMGKIKNGGLVLKDGLWRLVLKEDENAK